MLLQRNHFATAGAAAAAARRQKGGDARRAALINNLTIGYVVRAEEHTNVETPL